MNDRWYPGSLSPEVTEMELKHRGIARRAAAEGMVLMKNDGVLPLKKAARVAVYGFGARYTVKGGTGSGSVNNRSNVSVDEGLRGAGFHVVNDAWLDDYDRRYREARKAWERLVLDEAGENPDFMRLYRAHATHPMEAPAGLPVTAESSEAADAAIVVISRISGEGADRKAVKGDYYLSDAEETLLKQVTAVYPKTVVILNVGGIMDLGFLDELPVSAVVLMHQAGMEGGNALADVLSGAVCPSARLTDTWPLHYEDLPGSADFSHNNGNIIEEKYVEGIYVGYRWHDTFDVPARYVFGHGLSYTSFSLKAGALSVKDGTACQQVTVTNTGSAAGRETVLLFASCPAAYSPKEKRRLVAFGKTGLLAPGASETLSLAFSLELLESWHGGQAGWYMEGGRYVLFLGTSMADLTAVGSLALSGLRWTQHLPNICPLNDSLKEVRPDPDRIAAWRACFEKLAEGLPCVSIDGEVKERPAKAAMPEDPWLQKAEDFLQGLTVTEKALLCCGKPKGKGRAEFIGSAAATVPGAAGETTDILKQRGIAPAVMADGPAGLRLTQKYQLGDDGNSIEMEPVPRLLNRIFGWEYLEEGRPIHYQYCSAIPVGTLLAQSFDLRLMEEVGDAIREEMELFHVALWLAPGMNIHRNPLCGRNFEYYSEDPLLSGRMAAALTKGVQRTGRCGTTIKHFTCNNQEENRMGVSSIVSERALREIYLKGFEIAIRESQPLAIMSSYNKVNGVHTANSHDLCTEAARNEWGFGGIIMTDWTTTNGNGSSAARCVEAGNDLVMPGTEDDIQEIIDAVDGKEDLHLSMEALDGCARRMLALLMKTQAAE